MQDPGLILRIARRMARTLVTLSFVASLDRGSNPMEGDKRKNSRNSHRIPAQVLSILVFACEYKRTLCKRHRTTLIVGKLLRLASPTHGQKSSDSTMAGPPVYIPVTSEARAAFVTICALYVISIIVVCFRVSGRFLGVGLGLDDVFAILALVGSHCCHATCTAQLGSWYLTDRVGRC